MEHHLGPSRRRFNSFLPPLSLGRSGPRLSKGDQVEGNLRLDFKKKMKKKIFDKRTLVFDKTKDGLA